MWKECFQLLAFFMVLARFTIITLLPTHYKCGVNEAQSYLQMSVTFKLKHDLNVNTFSARFASPAIAPLVAVLRMHTCAVLYIAFRDISEHKALQKGFFECVWGPAVLHAISACVLNSLSQTCEPRTEPAEDTHIMQHSKKRGAYNSSNEFQPRKLLTWNCVHRRLQISNMFDIPTGWRQNQDWHSLLSFKWNLWTLTSVDTSRSQTRAKIWSCGVFKPRAA